MRTTTTMAGDTIEPGKLLRYVTFTGSVRVVSVKTVGDVKGRPGFTGLLMENVRGSHWRPAKDPETGKRVKVWGYVSQAVDAWSKS